MGFCCKVDNNIRLFLLEELVHTLTVADVQLDKPEIQLSITGSSVDRFPA